MQDGNFYRPESPGPSGLASSRAQLAAAEPQLGSVLPSDWDELSQAARQAWCIGKSLFGTYPSVCDEILSGGGGTQPPPTTQPPVQQAGFSMEGALPWLLGGVAVLAGVSMFKDRE